MGSSTAPPPRSVAAWPWARIAVCLRRTRDVLDDRQVPLVGLTSAFVFAAQMLNFPVAAGTSGHLLGGVLAAVLVGPWAGALAVSVVLVVQALLFADGGLSALGLNVVNMALIGALGGYLVFAAIRALLPKTKASVVAAAGVAAALAPTMAALAFTAEYALGGNGAASRRHRGQGDDRRAPADRRRRGRDHGDDHLRRDGHQARPRARRSTPRCARTPHARSRPGRRHEPPDVVDDARGRWSAGRAGTRVPRRPPCQFRAGRAGEGRCRPPAWTPANAPRRLPAARSPTTPSAVSTTPVSALGSPVLSAW